MRKAWDEEDIEFLTNNYNKIGSQACAEKLNRTERSVYLKAFKLGIKGRPNGSWNEGKIQILNEEELEFLKKNYYKGLKYCSKQLNKDKNSLQKVASKLGLKVNRKEAIKHNSDLQKHLKNHAEKVLKKYNQEVKYLDEKSERLVKKLYKDGLPSTEIAEIFGCSIGPIKKILENIPKRNVSEYEHHVSKTQGHGETHHSWKGGYKSVYSRIRDLNKYWEWRRAVASRDNHQCQYCGSTEEKLHVHHVKSLKTLINEYCDKNNKLVKELDYNDINSDFFYDTNNGLTLCEPCHMNLHKIQGKD